ncbi:hypothetical protein M9H77_10454 [Catharanthus roseus]|uniref:Uncharacterized protein n=1 Tax=Catharanthus roseus TaxID=4058 RepID=A0ACC0BBT2_CATRO|nr:hypothetical protein M9H77_10454 [Catharanthus roseus]
MAELFLADVAESVVFKAFSLAAEEISRLWGVNQDLQSLARKLEMIQALRIDAESKHHSSRAVAIWVNTLQSLAADADNLLDDFSYEVLRKKIEKPKLRDKVRGFFSSSNSLGFRFKMAYKIQKINFSLDQLYRESDLIGLRPAEIINISSDLGSHRVTDPFVDDLDIVGRTDDVEKIMTMLTSNSSENETELSVISIVGMAGQGKTTVAQSVYNNEKVVSHFEKRIWICAFEDFKVERILNDMVQSLTATMCGLTIREAIVKRLKEELSGKRFLLVLDDVWNEKEDLWECLKKCVREIGGSNGSRIIVTTRSERVVSTMQTTFTYRLGMLSDQDGWALFDKIAFAKGGAIRSPELVDIGKRIVKRCGGMPLAVKAIGGLMYSKKEEHEWLRIEKSKIWGSLDGLDGVLPVIRLSYSQLPSLSLKQCFAYCSIFQKGFVMNRKQLIQLWMAQGLLSPPRGNELEMEDIGNNYFNILTQRSLLQDAETNEYGSIEACKMHDLVHEFAIQASKGYCLIIEEELVNDNVEAVHLNINCNQKKIPKTSRGFLPKLQTLFLVRGILDEGLANFKRLRALVVTNESVTVLPSSIAKLKHLRYLDISGTAVNALPGSITKLYNLQTLRLYDLQELPKRFENLVNLRHFYIKGEENPNETKCLLPRIGQLTSLRTLSFFVVSRDRGCQIKELGSLHNLEDELKIFDLQNVANRVEAKKANLSAMIQIKSLELHWTINTREESNDDDVLGGLEPHSNLKCLRIVNFMGRNLPSWMVSTSQPFLLRNIVQIKLENLQKCEQIPPLGHIRSLKIIEIFNMDSIKLIGSEFYGCTDVAGASANGPQISTVAFPSLKVLIFWGMRSLEKWFDAAGQSPNSSVKAFPHLEKLEIWMCPNLRCLPENLGNLACLEKFHIYGCSNLISMPDIHGLQSLQSLGIDGCDNLRALPNGLEACISLHRLSISFPATIQFRNLQLPTNLRRLTLAFSDDADSRDDIVDFPWPNYTIPESKEGNQKCPFGYLESVRLFGMPKIKSLPKQLQHLPALKSLSLRNFDGLEALPEWLGNIRSLQSLHILGCKNLAHFPSVEAMQRLTNLYELAIVSCPILSESCNEGSERHKIAHIPVIRT